MFLEKVASSNFGATAFFLATIAIPAMQTVTMTVEKLLLPSFGGRIMIHGFWLSVAFQNYFTIFPENVKFYFRD